MAGFKPVTISKGSFNFCRTCIAVLLWASIIFKANWIVILVFLIMLFSAIFKVAKAPLILLYNYTIDKIWPSEKVIVDEKGIFVSHVTAMAFSLLCILLLYFANGIVGLIATIMFALLQTSAALGFCSALKLYTCMCGGNCCRIGKFAKKVKDKHV